MCTVHDLVTVQYAMRFHGLDTTLDRTGRFCLDLMCSVFLTLELVSILLHSFTEWGKVGDFSVSQFLASFIDHPRAQRNIPRIIVSV